MPATSGRHATCIKRYGEDTGAALYRETLDSYDLVKRLIADEAIDCEFREVGTSSWRTPPSHVPELEQPATSLASVGVAATLVPRERIREEIGSDAYYGALAVEGSGLLHPARYFAGLAAAADARRRRPARGRARTVDPAPGRRPLRRRDRRAARSSPARSSSPRTATRTAWRRRMRRRVIPIGSYIIASEPLPEDLARELSPKGRSFFDTKNFLYYWHVSAGSPDDLRRPGELPADVRSTSTARDPARGLLEVHPQLADYRIEYAWGGNVGFTFDRMPHAGRTKDGVTYAVGCCGTGVALMTHLGRGSGEWLAGGDAPALSRARFPLVPAPYEGRPWFLPFVGEWYPDEGSRGRRTRGSRADHAAGRPSAARRRRVASRWSMSASVAR